MTESLKKYLWDHNSLAILVVSEILNQICETSTEKMVNMCVVEYFLVYFAIVEYTYYLHTM